mmetsp:Transcript_12296/g.33780  ORF Transcript_12296/g.33780 Transcript_12296/m.33780 type:complete len:212 (+) Transcript_12296:755-1390(+)
MHVGTGAGGGAQGSVRPLECDYLRHIRAFWFRSGRTHGQAHVLSTDPHAAAGVVWKPRSDEFWKPRLSVFKFRCCPEGGHTKCQSEWSVAVAEGDCGRAGTHVSLGQTGVRSAGSSQAESLWASSGNASSVAQGCKNRFTSTCLRASCRGGRWWCVHHRPFHHPPAVGCLSVLEPASKLPSRPCVFSRVASSVIARPVLQLGAEGTGGKRS